MNDNTIFVHVPWPIVYQFGMTVSYVTSSTPYIVTEPPCVSLKQLYPYGFYQHLQITVIVHGENSQKFPVCKRRNIESRSRLLFWLCYDSIKFLQTLFGNYYFERFSDRTFPQMLRKNFWREIQHFKDAWKPFWEKGSLYKMWQVVILWCSFLDSPNYNSVC